MRHAVMTRDEILMELQKMWGEQWAITLDVVGGRPDVFDIYPKEYIKRSNELVRALNRLDCPWMKGD